MRTMARLASSPSSLREQIEPALGRPAPGRRRRGRRAAGRCAASAASPVPTASASAPEPLEADRQRGADVLLVVDDQDPQTAGDASWSQRSLMDVGESYLVPPTAVAGGGRGRPNCWSSARFSSSTLTRGSPRKPRSRPSTWFSMTARTRSAATLRARAMRGTCQSAAVGREVGIEAAGRGGDELVRDRQRRVGVLLAAGARRRRRRGRAASSRSARGSSPTRRSAS